MNECTDLNQLYNIYIYIVAFIILGHTAISILYIVKLEDVFWNELGYYNNGLISAAPTLQAHLAERQLKQDCRMMSEGHR